MQYPQPMQQRLHAVLRFGASRDERLAESSSLSDLTHLRRRQVALRERVPQLQTRATVRIATIALGFIARQSLDLRRMAQQRLESRLQEKVGYPLPTEGPLHRHRRARRLPRQPTTHRLTIG